MPRGATGRKGECCRKPGTRRNGSSDGQCRLCLQKISGSDLGSGGPLSGALQSHSLPVQAGSEAAVAWVPRGQLQVSKAIPSLPRVGLPMGLPEGSASSVRFAGSAPFLCPRPSSSNSLDWKGRRTEGSGPCGGCKVPQPLQVPCEFSSTAVAFPGTERGRISLSLPPVMFALCRMKGSCCVFPCKHQRPPSFFEPSGTGALFAGLLLSIKGR